MSSRINSWFGRNGNNIIQLINCVHYSFYINDLHHINFPKHSLFKRNIIENKEKEIKNYNRRLIKTDKNNFFYARHMGFTLSPKQMREIAQKYLVDITTLNLNNIEDITIHIRGGDSITGSTIFYQPPLKFYKLILDKYEDKNIKLMYEDKNNPCVDELNKLSNVEIQSKSIKEDIEKLCSGKVMVLSFSTFSLMVFYLSKNVEEIYLPDYMVQEWYPNMDWGVKTNILKITNYSKDNWLKNNTDQKKKLILNYDDLIN